MARTDLAETATADAREASPDRVLVVTCGALAREIVALCDLNGWEHFELQCLPASLHLYPDRIPDAVKSALEAGRTRFDRIFVAYADCGTGGRLKALCDEMGVEMIEGPHCYSFYEGNSVFAARGDSEMRTFYLTDFLVRQFDAFVWRPMGLDRHPELLDMLFGGYTTLTYLAQTDDPELDKGARQCAARLKLAYRRRYTGYGDLEAALGHVKDSPAD